MTHLKEGAFLALDGGLKIESDTKKVELMVKVLPPSPDEKPPFQIFTLHLEQKQADDKEAASSFISIEPMALAMLADVLELAADAENVETRYLMEDVTQMYDLNVRSASDVAPKDVDESTMTRIKVTTPSMTKMKGIDITASELSSHRRCTVTLNDEEAKTLAKTCRRMAHTGMRMNKILSEMQHSTQNQGE